MHLKLPLFPFLLILILTLIACNTDAPSTDGDTPDGNVDGDDPVDGDDVVVDGDQDASDGDDPVDGDDVVVDGDQDASDGDETTDGDDDPDGDEADGDIDPELVWMDVELGLMWQNPPADTQLAFEEALAYCENLELVGFDDWRLPGIGELRSLIRGCPTMEIDGTCNIREGSCLSPSCMDNDACADNCSYLQGPSEEKCYTVDDLVEEEGDCGPYWSSVLTADNSSWSLGYLSAALRVSYHFNPKNVRCVRSTTGTVDGDIDQTDGDTTDGDVVDGDVTDGDITLGAQCDVCEDHPDCEAEHACLGFQGAPSKFCAQSCLEQTDCNENFTCQDIGGSVNYCIPDRSYYCEDNDLWRMDACGTEEELLECEDGVRVCNAETKSCDLIVDGDYDTVDGDETDGDMIDGDADGDQETLGTQCDECVETDDCAPDHFCININLINRSICVKSCEEQVDCDNNFNCINFGASSDYCLPGANIYCENNDLQYFDACLYQTVAKDCNDENEVCNAESRSCESTLDPTSIYDIQYTTVAGDGDYPSLLVDQQVLTNGIVTATGFAGQNNNFFISEAAGGAWRGVYVYNADMGANVGDEVQVIGTVKEFYGLTEIVDGAVTILSTGNTVPDPSDIATTTLTQAVSGEAYEGVLVKVANVTVTQEPDDHAQWYVDDGSGACQVDDGIYTASNIVSGDSYDFIVGTVDYNYSEYGIHPRSDLDIQEAQATPVVGPLIQNQWTTFTWPYNAYYPEKEDGPNGHYGNACGPTSIARILYYWQYPANGVGDLQFTDYWGNAWDVDLESLNLDYSQMPSTLAHDATEAEYQETARLFEATGAVGEYTHIWAIGAEDDLPSTFVDYFNFSESAEIVYRENFTRQEWIDLFKAELDAGRPIVIVGRTPESPAPGQSGRVYGHWWVCDGYNSDDQFYADYAFNGIRGYYDIDNLGGIYTAYNRAVIGLEPDTLSE